MNKYEVVVIFQADLEESTLTTLIDRVKGWITTSGGSVDKVDMWGKRRLAYIIRKQVDGVYVLFEATFPPAFSSELERNLRLTEPILRFLIKSVED